MGNGRNESRTPVASVVYFARFSAGTYISTKKMVVVK